jgi:trehalose 6-phosphate phosphatase
MAVGAMHDASTKWGRAGAILANPQQWGLFIDIDGTLLKMAPTPEAVSVPPDVVPILERLTRGLDGAVAFLTGRCIADADRLFAPLQLVAAGVHGTEMRYQRHGPIDQLAPPIPASVVRAISDISRATDGIRVEPKGTGVAVHYRNVPLVHQALASELAAIVTASAHDLVLRQGNKVLEAVPKRFSKGTALRRLASQPPFAGRRPIMIGDDAGDEPALASAEELGGIGLRVAGEHFGSDGADFDCVDDVLGWLGAVADRLGVKAEDSSAR